MISLARMAVAAGRLSGVIRGKDLVEPRGVGKEADDPRRRSAGERRTRRFFFFNPFLLLRVCRVDDGPPGAMIIIALELSVG